MRVRQVDIGARELIDRVARGLIQREQADRICVEEGSGSDAHLPRSPDGAAGRCWLPLRRPTRRISRRTFLHQVGVRQRR
jgi:hypothetical protein